MSHKRGFTLIELLIVVTILAILTVMMIFSISSNLAKSRDSKRKADLDRLKVAFEEYYGDYSSYPPATILDDCGSEALNPYLRNIPCDPRTKKSYCYIYDADNNGQNYRLLSSLEFKDDPIITKLSCEEDPTYCGYESECTTLGTQFNYGVSSSNVLVNNENAGSGSIDPTPTPTPTPLGPLPSTIPGILACDPNRECNNYGSTQNAQNSGCPVTWESGTDCNGACSSLPSYGLCTR